MMNGPPSRPPFPHRPDQQYPRGPPESGISPSGPAHGNFSPPPGYRGPPHPLGQGAFLQRGPPVMRGPFPPSFPGPPRPGHHHPFIGQVRPALQEAQNQPQQRPPSVGPNQLQRPVGPLHGPPMQRPPPGGFHPPGQGRPPNAQGGPPPPASGVPPPFMRPPPQQGLLQSNGPPTTTQPPKNSTSLPPPQRPPIEFSGPSRPPPNFRPPSWGPPPPGGLLSQQGGPMPGFPPGVRPPLQWPPGHPGMQVSRPFQGAFLQQGVDFGAQGGAPAEPKAPSAIEAPSSQKEEAKGGDEGDRQAGGAVKAWTAHKNDEGVTYYYNGETGESTYEKPKDFVGEEVEIVPVAWERIEGTDWHLVTTNVDSKYYYNTVTQETSWQVPAAVAEQKDKAKAAVPPAPANGVSAIGTVKKKLQEEDAMLEVAREPPPHEAAEPKEHEQGSQQEEAEQANKKEKRAADFKEMLKEKKVPPFAKWDKELPKIFADPRFKAVPTTAERRALFDRFVKTRAEEERVEKREALRAVMNGFRELLDECAEELDHTVTYADFETMKGDDPRFQALEKKEREALLNERVAPLRKAEEERVKKEREAAMTAFHELLAERGVNEATKWAQIKEDLRDDERYQGVARAEREQVFADFISKWKGEKESEVEDKLKVHEREARKRKERELEELERIRTKAKQKDALDSYKGLLAQKVKEADATWPDWQRRLAKAAEELGVTPHLELKELEHLFKEHVRGILDGCVREYKRLLAEALPEDTIQNEDPDGRISLDSWTAAKGMMKDDPRFKRLPKPQRELLYRQYTDDMRKKLNLPARTDKTINSARGPAMEAPRRDAYKDHRDKRQRR